jgi:FkbM family methyltransferase
MSLVDRVIRRTYGRRRFQWLYRRLHNVALTGLNYGYENPALNGEYALLDRMANTWNKRPVVVFDVGAFHGTWSAAVLDRASSATVYAFEPVPSSFAQLAANLEGRVNLNNCALGTTAGTAEIFAPSAVPELASLHHRDLSNFSLAADSLGSVPVRTIDDFCAEREITHIDLLKLDTEGYERSVVAGARRLLETRAIDAIQFEFGGANIDAKVFLRDIIGVLAPEFEVFRLLRDGLEPVRMDEREEIFTYVNFVALRRGAV